MNRDDEPNALVLDIGSYWVRGGFSGDDAPRVLVPPVVGTPKDNKPIDRQRGEKDHYIGDEAQIRREMLTIKHPIEKGIITNWEQMEKVKKFCVFPFQFSHPGFRYGITHFM